MYQNWGDREAGISDREMPNTQEEQLVPERMKDVVERMIYNNQEPLREEVAGLMEKPPSILQRKKVIPRLTEKLKDFVNTFYGGV